MNTRWRVVVVHFCEVIPFLRAHALQGRLGAAAPGQVPEQKEEGEGEPEPGSAEDEGDPRVADFQFLPPIHLGRGQGGREGPGERGIPGLSAPDQADPKVDGFFFVGADQERDEAEAQAVGQADVPFRSRESPVEIGQRGNPPGETKY